MCRCVHLKALKKYVEIDKVGPAINKDSVFAKQNTVYICASTKHAEEGEKYALNVLRSNSAGTIMSWFSACRNGRLDESAVIIWPKTTTTHAPRAE